MSFQLALTLKDEVWTWGSSPQKLRLGARSAKLVKMKGGVTESQDDSCIPTTSPVIQEDNTHLYPIKIDLSNVKGKIVKVCVSYFLVVRIKMVDLNSRFSHLDGCWLASFMHNRQYGMFVCLGSQSRFSVGYVGLGQSGIITINMFHNNLGYCRYW